MRKPSLAYQERYDYIPTGELVLKAWHRTGSKSEWADGKRHRVEEKLNDFMISVVCIADSEIRSQEQQVIYERKRAEEERQHRGVPNLPPSGPGHRCLAAADSVRAWSAASAG